jgi:hypothetical protein
MSLKPFHILYVLQGRSSHTSIFTNNKGDIFKADVEGIRLDQVTAKSKGIVHFDFPLRLSIAS